MSDLRNRRKLPHIEVTAATLKWYGCITMLFYTISMSVIQNGMLHVNQLSHTQLREMWAADPNLMILSSWAAVFQLLGGLAIPVFAFLLVEGFQHTKNYKAYLLRMLLFSVISEIPYDFAMSRSLFDWTRQNMLFSLALCLVMLYGLKLFEASRFVQILIVIAAVFWSSLMRSGFGLCLVLLTAMYYILRNKPTAKIRIGGLISLMYVTGPISNFVLKRYNGQLGGKWNKYIFYVLYPLHLLILGTVTYLITRGG